MDQEKKCLFVSSVVGRDIPPEGLKHFFYDRKLKITGAKLI